MRKQVYYVYFTRFDGERPTALINSDGSRATWDSYEEAEHYARARECDFRESPWHPRYKEYKCFVSCARY